VRGPLIKKVWILLLPLAAFLVLVPTYLKTSRERMAGPAHVRQLTFDDKTSDEVINEFAVASPDGKYFVLQHSEDPKLVTMPDGTKKMDFKETSNWDIYRYNVDGSGRLRLTDDPASEDQPTWSPDAKTIVFRKLNGKSFDLYLMDADGGNKRDLVIDPAHDEKTPAFSTDGKKVVFFSNRDGIKWNLYSIDVETHKVERLTHDKVEDKHPQYTPDGRVVFHSNRGGATHVTLQGGEEFDVMNLWALDPGTGEISALTTSQTATSAYGMRDNRHAWISPDGKYVAYHSNIIEADRNHPGIHRKRHRELCITTIDGSRRVYLTNGDHRNFKHPTWAADGKGLFFVFKEKSKPWNAGFMDVTEALERLQ
jgi:Tol biopolymer transport system component